MSVEKTLRDAYRLCRSTGCFCVIDCPDVEIIHRATDIESMIRRCKRRFEELDLDEKWCRAWKHEGQCVFALGHFAINDLSSRVKAALFLACYNLEKGGMGTSKLLSIGNNVSGDERMTIKCIDDLIRGGLLVKAVTGGIWWVGNWRSHHEYIPYMYPGAAVDSHGKVYTARRFYGRKAKKNYQPSTFYTK